MPSTIFSLPVVAAPSAAPASPNLAVEQSAGESRESFDAVLTKAAPSAGKSTPARCAVKGSARSQAVSANTAQPGDEIPSDAVPADPKASALGAEELAALLALIGAPGSLQQPPPPLQVPVDFSAAGDTRTADAADVSIETDPAFAAPMSGTGDGTDSFSTKASISGARPSNTAGFSFALEAAGEGTTARELLKAGAEVIDYQLAPDSAPVAPIDEPLARSEQPESATVARAGFELPPETLVAPELATTPPVVSAKEAIPTKPAAETAAAVHAAAAPSLQPAEVESSRVASPKKISTKAGSEKFAVNASNRESSAASGVNPSIPSAKYKFLNVADEELAIEGASVGTSAANWGGSMNPDARSTPLAARLTDGSLTVPGAAPSSFAGVARELETAAPKSASAPQAAQIVSEIRDIADGLWAVERNSVEVRFNFSENERLSVKVEYRDGIVQTTFRTDSPELRDTIAREWQAQIATTSEARPYRVADPVFNTPPVDARGFSLGGDSSRHQRQAEQSAGAPHTFATASGRVSSSSSVGAAPANAFTRPDTALHLHAFA